MKRLDTGGCKVNSISKPYLTSLTVCSACTAAGGAPRKLSFLPCTRWWVCQVCSVNSPACEGRLHSFVERRSAADNGAKRKVRSDRESAQCRAVLKWRDDVLALTLACALSMLFGQMVAGHLQCQYHVLKCTCPCILSARYKTYERQTLDCQRSSLQGRACTASRGFWHVKCSLHPLIWSQILHLAFSHPHTSDDHYSTYSVLQSQ